MSRKKTLPKSDCDHISKVAEWGYILVDGDVKSCVNVWGCTKCDIKSDKPFKSEVFKETDHSNCKWDPCFGCKAKGLQFNAGDATRDISDKKWTAELSAYKEARAQGMQPGGTTMAHIEAAYTASENLGKAYNSETMPKAHQITKKTAEVMKEVGI